MGLAESTVQTSIGGALSSDLNFSFCGFCDPVGDRLVNIYTRFQTTILLENL